MKNPIRPIVALASLLPISSFAIEKAASQPAEASAIALQAWIDERAERDGERKMSLLASGQRLPDGMHRILSVDDLQAPENIRTYILESIKRRQNQILEVDAGVLPAESTVLRELGASTDDPKLLQRRLSLPLSDLSRTVLGAARLVATKEAGARGSEGATGASRYFRLPDVGVVEFHEEDYRAPGTLIETFREAVNAEVNGTPAMLSVTRGSDGRARIELSWINELKSYGLTLTTDHAEHFERYLGLIRDIASAVRD